MSFKVWRIAAGLALVCTLAAGVAAGAFMEVDGDPVDYVKIRLWKEDGALKSEFWGMETEFGEIAGDFRRIAGRGHADWPVHWLVDGEVTVRELSEKMGTLAALGFTNQFFMAAGATPAQRLEFDLANIGVGDSEEFGGLDEPEGDGEEGKWRELGEMTVPKLEFEKAAAEDVLAFIGEISDMEVRVEPEDALEGAPPLTMHLQGAPVRDIAQWTGELLGFRVELEETEGGKFGWRFWREGDAGGAKGYRFPAIHLYGIEDGKKKLRWTWWLPSVHREATIYWDSREIDGAGYVLLSFEQQLMLEVYEVDADGSWTKVSFHPLGELFDLEFQGDIAFDGKIEEDGDGIRVVLRRWDATHQGEPEVRHFPKWRNREGETGGRGGEDGTTGTIATNGVGPEGGTATARQDGADAGLGFAQKNKKMRTRERGWRKE